MSQPEVRLKVLETYTRDVVRGAVRLDYDAMDALAASTGDVIEIKGKRRTVAKYPRPEDAKKHVTEAIVTYEHFQEAAKKVRSSRESNPTKNVAVPYYR